MASADALIMTIPDTRADIFENCRNCKLLDKEQITYIINNAPTIEAEPIRHGHWVMLHKTHKVDEDNDYDWRCSECNHVDCHNISVEVPYCWNCGAVMDEVKKDEID